MAWLAGALVTWIGACDGGGSNDPAPPAGPAFDRTEAREDCAAFDAARVPLFGDLHVHTALSWDAWGWDVRFTPDDAYAFARGGTLEIPTAAGTVPLALDRPLDFAAVTDHGEYLAEVRACGDPSSPVYDHPRCVSHRSGGLLGQATFGLSLVADAPQRFSGICGAGGIDCRAVAGDVWSEIQAAAQRAYDRSASCSFTSLIGYEWTGANNIANIHRNVIFRNDDVPVVPTSHFEAPQPDMLWRSLQADCLEAGGRCDVLSIPHNTNISNGTYFRMPEDLPGGLDALAELAQLRATMEPIVEIFQGKGDSECRNGFAGFLGEPDELCDFEKYEPPDTPDCGDGTGIGGPIGAGLGCRSRFDFIRGTLLAGMQEERRFGVNPYPLGFIASTDTHNAAPGSTAEEAWLGHHGQNDDEASERLAEPGLSAGIVGNPGGLAAVWAEENSRDAIFAALRRKETFGTSGPRIVPRFFGAWNLPDDLCGRSDLVDVGYERGVPMGGTLPPRRGSSAPTFVVSALRDANGGALQRIQIVKGWVDADGEGRFRVFDVAGDAANGAGVDTTTCEAFGPGADSLCARWVDPEFDPAQPAYYYARVVENPTCRWSTYFCNALPADSRPDTCDDPATPKAIQERAWTSPIWYRPGG